MVGKITLEVTCGRDRQSGQWKCPARERWGLGPHEKMTPELEDRVCLTATLTGSYEAAARLSAKWGNAVDDETIRAHVRRVGRHAVEPFHEGIGQPLFPMGQNAREVGLDHLCDLEHREEYVTHMLLGDPAHPTAPRQKAVSSCLHALQSIDVL